jgi:hypothetical protein
MTVRSQQLPTLYPSMRTTALVLLCSIYAVSAQAESMPISHKVGLGLYTASATLDLHSTYMVLQAGGRENNPLGRISEGSPTKTIVLGAAVDAVAVPLLYKWLGRKHPALTTVLLYSVSAFRFNLAAGNYREVR